MSAILDRGSLLFASISVLAATLLLNTSAPWLPISFFTPLLVLAVVYVPGTLLLATLARALSAASASSSNAIYSPLLTCTAMAFAAAEIPLAIASWFVPGYYLLIAAVLYFAFLMFFAVRTVFGVENGIAAWSGRAFLASAGCRCAGMGPPTRILGMLASPFFLFYAWYYLGGELSGLGAKMRSRQNFSRMLHAAAVSLHDGEAQYQLGLIYKQRHQYTEAIERFKKAVAIDPALTGTPTSNSAASPPRTGARRATRLHPSRP